MTPNANTVGTVTDLEYRVLITKPYGMTGEKIPEAVRDRKHERLVYGAGQEAEALKAAKQAAFYSRAYDGKRRTHPTTVETVATIEIPGHDPIRSIIQTRKVRPSGTVCDAQNRTPAERARIKAKAARRRRTSAIPTRDFRIDFGKAR